MSVLFIGCVREAERPLTSPGIAIVEKTNHNRKTKIIEEEDQNEQDGFEENYEFRGMGMGEVSGIRDRLKMLGLAVHDISERRGNWAQIQNPNDIFANTNMMLVYAYESMLNDIGPDGNLNPAMHAEIPKYSVTEINFATMLLNILDLGQERGMRLAEAMLAVYEYRVKIIKEDLEEMRKEAEINADLDKALN